MTLTQPENFDHADDLLGQAERLVDENFRTAQSAQRERAVFPRYSLTDLLEMPSKEWLIDQICGKGDVIEIHGAPGSGKTFVVLDLAFSAALGRPFAKRFAIPRPLTVAYCAGEGRGGLAQRIQAAAEYYAVAEVPNLFVYLNAPQLYNSKDPCNAARFVDEYAAAQAVGEVPPLDILILDTLHTVSIGADENSSQDMGEILRRAQSIADMLGSVVALIHHTNRAGTGERGSSSLRGWMGCMIEVKEAGNGRIMSCEKLKDGDKWKPQTFDLIAKADSVRVDWGDVGESGKDAGQKAADKKRLIGVMVAHPKVKFDVTRLAGAIGKGSNHVRNLLAELERDGLCRRELTDPSKERSNRNPWLFSLPVSGK